MVLQLNYLHCIKRRDGCFKGDFTRIGVFYITSLYNKVRVTLDRPKGKVKTLGKRKKSIAVRARTNCKNPLLLQLITYGIM